MDHDDENFIEDGYFSTFTSSSSSIWYFPNADLLVVIVRHKKWHFRTLKRVEMWNKQEETQFSILLGTSSEECVRNDNNRVKMDSSRINEMASWCLYGKRYGKTTWGYRSLLSFTHIVSFITTVRFAFYFPRN